MILAATRLRRPIPSLASGVNFNVFRQVVTTTTRSATIYCRAGIIAVLLELTSIARTRDMRKAPMVFPLTAGEDETSLSLTVNDRALKRKHYCDRDTTLPHRRSPRPASSPPEARFSHGKNHRLACISSSQHIPMTACSIVRTNNDLVGSTSLTMSLKVTILLVLRLRKLVLKFRQFMGECPVRTEAPGESASSFQTRRRTDGAASSLSSRSSTGMNHNFSIQSH